MLQGRDRAVKNTVASGIITNLFLNPKTLYLHPILGKHDTGANLGWPRTVTAYATLRSQLSFAATERPG